MPVRVGERVGPYTVTGTLGAGGMGEVYRARDGRLNRDVALKVLPDAFVSDPERLARFEREAQVLASLNHPHIAAIYGLEEGALDSGERIRALVLELVEGETLADRIARGAIPIDDALTIAREVTQALDAAHERGVVHRDLKPANIKITPGGSVKVLDFGLAKFVEPSAAPSAPGSRPPALSMSPTMASPTMLTGVGVILGTAAYMSPEQAKGREADHRSDVWAFGCVLFEMLTGRRPFEGEDVSDTLAAVLRSEPDWTRLPRATPAPVLRLIRRCLQRDPQKRLRDIGDARIDLEDLALEPATPPPGTGANAGRSRVRRVAIAGAAATGLIGVGLASFAPSREPPSNTSVSRVEINLPEGVELHTLGRGVGVSPDGSRIAFIGVEGTLRRVYVRPVDRFEVTALRGTEGASWCCSFSRDGGVFAFGTADGALKRLSLADGLVTTVAAAHFGCVGDWAPDGSFVFQLRGGLYRTHSSGGEPVAVLEDDAKQFRWPAILPDGAILFASSMRGRADTSQIESFDPTTGQRHVVVARGTAPRYLPTGHLVFYRDDQLLAAPFDATARRTTGDAVRVFENLPAAEAGVPILDVSASGVLVYAPTTAAARLVWVSRQGAEQSLVDAPRTYANPRLDPKGRWLLVTVGGRLWSHDLVRASFSRVSTEGNTLGGFPVLTPDGARVVFRRPVGLRWQALDGSGQGGDVAGSAANDYPGSVSPDGQRLFFRRESPGTSGDIYVTPIQGGGTATALVKTPGNEGGARVSPDGRWLLYTSDESGRYEVYLRPAEGQGQRVTVSTQGGSQPLWNPNGREVFYRNDDKMMAVGVTTAGVPVLSEPRLLFEGHYAFGFGLTIANYDVSADGQRFVIVKEESSASRLNVVLNWSQELRRLAPGGGM